MKSDAIKSVLVILCLLITWCNGKQVSLIGPRTTAPNSKYRAFLDVNGLKNNEQLFVALRSKSQFFNTQKFENNANFNQEVEFEVPAEAHDTYNLMALVVAKKGSKNICLRNEATIFTTTSSDFFTLLQTDKPAYKPGDKVRFRVIVLDHETKPYKYTSINVNILNGEGNVTKTFTETRQSDYSLYENSYTLPDEPILGQWKVEVTVDSSKRKSSKTFLVKDFTPPPFQVYVETLPRVSFEGYQPKLSMKIYAKYPFDTMVKGTADIQAKVYLANNPTVILKEHSKSVKVEGGIETIEYDLKKDLDIDLLISTAIIEFDVVFTEDATSRNESRAVKVEVIPGSHYIKLEKQETFKPGFSYKIQASVYKINGELVNTTFEPLKMSLVYNYKNKQPTEEELITEESFLKGGKATFVLKPAVDVLSFTVRFEYQSLKIKEVIQPQRSLKTTSELIQVIIESDSPKIGEELMLRAESNSLMESLSVVVIGRTGLVYTKTYPEAAEENVFTFNLTITKEMAPEASVIVFYSRKHDGNVVFDQFKVELGFKGTNQLSIKLTKHVLKPNEMATFNLTTEKNSLVALLGVDQSIRFLGTNNEITKEDVDSKVKALNKLKTSEKYESDFSISNAVAVQLSKSKKHECLEWEEEFIKLPFGPLLAVVSRPDEEEEPAVENKTDLDTTLPHNDDLVRKYFPDVWIFETIETTDEVTQFRQVVPNNITTWTISGFSINQEHGLAIADSQDLKVMQSLVIKIGVPNSVKIGEVFKIDATVHNYLENRQRVELSIDFDPKELEIVEQKNVQGRPGCFEYKKSYASSTKTLNVNSQSAGSNFILARALKSGNVKINIEATGQDASDKVEKVVKVDYEGVKQFLNTPMFIDLKRPFSKEVAIDLPLYVDPATVKIEASISGNILGPALENVERFITMPEGCGEQKMKNFALSIYAYKYLKSNELANATMTEEALEAITNGYQSIKRRQSLSGGFKLWNENVDGVWLTAYAAQLLGEASELIEVDEDVMRKCLDFLRLKQNITDGYFEDDGENPRPKQGGQQHRKFYLTAFVMIAVAKNQKINNDFDRIVTSGTGFFKKQNKPADYEKAIAAYALALNSQTEHAEEYINSMNNNFLNIKLADIKALQVEIASYKILACLKLGKVEEAMTAFNWLIEARSASGGFFSTHDTVVGLQALSAMAEHLGNQNPAMIIQISGNELVKTEDIQSSVETKHIQLPSNERRFTVSATGHGMAYVNIFTEYKLKTKGEKNLGVTLNPVETDDGVRLEINIRAGRYVVTNMAVVDVELPSGYEYKKHKVSSDVKKVDVSDDKTRVFLYLESFNPLNANTVHIIEATKLFDVKDAKDSAIKAYDYYEPEQNKAVFFYNLDLSCSSSDVSRINHGERQNPALPPRNEELAGQHPPTTQTTGRTSTSTMRVRTASSTTPRINYNQNLITTRTSWHTTTLPTTTQRLIEESSDYRWTAGLMEKDISTTNGYWMLCVASMVSERVAVTGPSCGKNKSVWNLKLRVKKYNELNALVQFESAVDRVLNYEVFSLIFTSDQIQSVPKLEIISPGVKYWNYNCVVTAWDYGNKIVKQDVAFLSADECQQKINQKNLICIDKELSSNANIIVGNPLVCEINGKPILVGIGWSGRNQGAGFYTYLNYKNSIQRIINKNL